MSKIIIKNIEIIDASSPFHLKKMDLEIIDGQIINIKKKIEPATDDYRVITGKGKYMSHAWIDMLGDLYTQGYEYRESVETGIEAALSGGFGTVVMTPNHDPEIYTASHIRQIKKSAQHAKLNVQFLGAITKKLEGKDLSEMYDMYVAGAVAFSDGWKPIQNELILSQALEYVKSFDGLIIHIPIHNKLNAGGLMNESTQSVAYGISGQPTVAEDISVHNAISLAQYQNSRIHIAGVSSAQALDTIRKFKKQKVQVTCSVTPFHLLYNDSHLESYDSIYKVSPPLRSEKDRKALIKGIEDGTIDGISSFNRPLNWDEKNKEFEYAESGMASISYLWPMLLKAAPQIAVERWIELLVDNPSRILKIEKESIDKKVTGTYTIFDTTSPIDLNKKISQAYNIAPIDETFTGATVVI